MIERQQGKVSEPLAGGIILPIILPGIKSFKLTTHMSPTSQVYGEFLKIVDKKGTRKLPNLKFPDSLPGFGIDPCACVICE